MTKLDTRAARCDLTSRECCKLICGALVGVGAVLRSQELTRSVFGAAYRAFSGAGTGEVAELSGDADRTVTLVVLAATLGAIQEQAAPGAMDTALKWIYEQGDAFWSAVLVTTGETSDES